MQTEEPLTPEAKEQLLTVINRTRANLLGFSHLCVKTICRRAGKCSADPDICMTRFAPLASEDVRSGVDALVMGKFDGLSYDEVRESAPLEVGACEEWLARILESRRDSRFFAQRKSRQAPPALSAWQDF